MADSPAATPAATGTADPWPASRFNRTCRWVAAAWLLLIVTGSELVRHTDQDFGQYYLGGLVARLGEWQALYPTPIPGSPLNAGWEEGSEMKPRMAQLAAAHGANTEHRFIQTPATALLMSPLAWFSYRVTHWIWLLLLTLAAWGVALQAAAIFTTLAGKSTRAAGWLMLAIAVSPLTYRSIRVGNVSVFVAWCLGAMTQTLLVGRARAVRGAIAILLGALLKYATLALLVVALVKPRRNARLLALTAIGAACVIGLTLAFAGSAPVREFAKQIAPTLSRPARIPQNQSVAGLMLRASHDDRLTGRQSLAMNVARAVTLLTVLAGILRTRAATDGVRIAASCAALVAWLVMFAPVAWEHYYTYFLPFWGWLAWEATRPGWRRWAVLAIVATDWIPWPLILGRSATEPFGSIMLIGAIAIFVLALARLFNDTP